MGEGNRGLQYAIAYAVSLAAIAGGAFSAWPAPVLPKFHNNETSIEITPAEVAWMVSASSPGFMTGSLAVRFIADRFGRRASILLSALPYLVGSIIAATATVPWPLYAARFNWGFATGMYSSVVTLYLAELADKEIRGALALITRYMFNFGNLLMMCIGPFVSYTTLNYMLIALPVFHVVGCLWIPESPYYFLKDNKVDAARNVLKRLRNYKDDKHLEDDLLQLKADVKNEMRHSGTLKELFTRKKYRKAVIMATGLKTAQIMTAQLIVAQYLGMIMLESGTKISLTIIFIIFGIVRFVTGVMSSFLADKYGRRPLLIWSFFGTGISLLIIAVYFYVKENMNLSEDTISLFSFIPFASIIASNIISTLGYYSVIVVVPAEIFPLNVKTLALTCLSIYGGLLNFFEGRGYQALKDLTGLCGVFIILGLSGIGGSIFSYLCVPETKGKSLREIQEQLQGDLYENDEVFIQLNTKYVDVQKNLHEEKQLLDISKKEIIHP